MLCFVGKSITDEKVLGNCIGIYQNTRMDAVCPLCLVYVCREKSFLDCMKRDYRKGHRISRGALGGERILESFKVELEKKRKIDELAFH